MCEKKSRVTRESLWIKLMSLHNLICFKPSLSLSFFACISPRIHPSNLLRSSFGFNGLEHILIRACTSSCVILSRITVVERLLIWIKNRLGRSSCLDNSTVEVFYITNHICCMLLEWWDRFWPLFMLLLLIVFAKYRELSSLTYLRYILRLLFEKMQGLPLVLYKQIIQNENSTYSWQRGCW